LQSLRPCENATHHRALPIQSANRDDPGVWVKEGARSVLHAAWLAPVKRAWLEQRGAELTLGRGASSFAPITERSLQRGDQKCSRQKPPTLAAVHVRRAPALVGPWVRRKAHARLGLELWRNATAQGPKALPVHPGVQPAD